MDVFDLTAKLSLDDEQYTRGLTSALGLASSFDSKAGGIFSKFGNVAKAAMGAATAAVGTVVGAVTALTKQSIDAYADYEQMVGGVQKLYGNMGQTLEQYAASSGRSVGEVREEWQKLDDAQNLVLSNAEQAFKTAGMSANEYMEIATSFSAALINSLGGDTVKAAEQTDVAMRVISDNWNTFGGDLQTIQGTFQSISRGSYAMLDNLKLGKQCRIAQYKPCENGETLMKSA